MKLKSLAEENDGEIPDEKKAWRLRRYWTILDLALEETGGRELVREPGKRGRSGKPDGRNFVECLYNNS
ncbi:MAG: hypothetical protein LBQ79_05385, partial [Deltaproteobacteria bacterium]|nr:hypothetical protein [Deltaproteobacteria bacterium]